MAAFFVWSRRPAPPRGVRDNAAMSIRELSPAQARDRLAHGAVLIDVREAHERAGGMAEGARGMAKGELQADPASHLPQRDQEIVLICQSGKRSADTARFLAEAGYANVASVTGGTVAWREQSLPLVQPLASAADRDFYDRYSRHLLLPQVGEAGQRRLQQSRVLVLGAGGLGAPAGFYLAAAGVGYLRFADHDRVERSNLHRQIVHTEASVGQLKVDSARERLLALNPSIAVEAVPERVTSENVDALLEGVDVVLDGSDNFPLRYLLNDACIKHGKPLVYAAIERFVEQWLELDRLSTVVVDGATYPGFANTTPALFSSGMNSSPISSLNSSAWIAIRRGVTSPGRPRPAPNL